VVYRSGSIQKFRASKMGDSLDDALRMLYSSVEKIEAGESRPFMDKRSAEKVAGAAQNDTFAREFKAATDKARSITKGTESARKVLRGNDEKTWNDPSLGDWPENDYRIHVRNLPPDASDRDLAEAFQHYKSFAKARVVFDSSGRTRRYGFVSLLDVNDYIDAMKTMSNAFIKSRRVTLTPSKWKDRNRS
jgi:RNA recognition motif-containing protein